MPRWETYTAEAPYGIVFGDKAEFIKEQPGVLIKFLVKEYFKKRQQIKKLLKF